MTEQMKQPYFSVVMPAYGVEDYIEHAIKSIVKQTYGNWEIIVVNDCSKDKSAQIAEKAAKQDSRIRVVNHDVNKGLSAARNTGISEAQGEYIWFMDPDDYVDSTLLEKVKQSLEKNPAEVVLFGLNEEYYDRDGKLEYTHTICPKEQLYSSQQELRKAVMGLEQETLYGYAWNKIYNLEYMRKHSFQYKDVKLIEDIEFNIRYFMDIERLNVLAIAPYHYAKRLSQNLTNKFVPEYFEVHRQRIELLYKQHSYWKLRTEEIQQILGSLYGRYILSALERNCDKRSGMSHADRKRWCKAVFSQRLFKELIPEARAKESKALSITLWLLRGKRVIPCLAMGRGVHLIRNGMPMIYSKVKSGR